MKNGGSTPLLFAYIRLLYHVLRVCQGFTRNFRSPILAASRVGNWEKVGVEGRHSISGENKTRGAGEIEHLQSFESERGNPLGVGGWGLGGDNVSANPQFCEV